MKHSIIIISIFLGLGNCSFNIEREPLQLLNVLGVFMDASGGSAPASSQEESTEETTTEPPQPEVLRYRVGGTVTGLTGSGLVLSLNGSENLSLDSSGSFQFSTELDTGSNYSVAVSQQPSSPSQTCTVGNGTGTIAESNISNVTINCLLVPIIQDISPKNFESLSPTQPVVIRFNKTMLTTSCSLNETLPNSLLAGNAYTSTWETTTASNDTLRITPDTSWNSGLERVLRISGCEDTEGLVAESGGSVELELRYFVVVSTDAFRYVSNTGGSDSNDCKTPATSCASIQHAYADLSGNTECTTNKDCVLFVQSGSYAPSNTINILDGISIIGSFNADFTSKNVFTSPTNIRSINLPGSCGDSDTNPCRTIFVTNVTAGTRLETIRILGKDEVLYSRGIEIGASSDIRLNYVLSVAGNSSLANAVSDALHIRGTGIRAILDAGIYTGANLTGSSGVSTAIRIQDAPSVEFRMIGAGIGYRSAPERNGIFLSGSSNAKILVKFSTWQRVEPLPDTLRAYGFRMEGSLNGTELVLNNSNIISFESQEESTGLFLNSTDLWTSPVPVVHSNSLSGGKIEPGTSHKSRGVELVRVGGYFLNNRITGGELTGDGSVFGIESTDSIGLKLQQNSIASGSGSGLQRAVSLSAQAGTDGLNNVIIENNNLAANTNPSGICLDMESPDTPENLSLHNNNFHSCGGGHARFNAVSYYRFNCNGTATPGSLAENTACGNPLTDSFTTSTATGNIDEEAGFVSADPNDTSVPVNNWNLQLRSDGTVLCRLARGGKSLTSALTNPVNISEILGVDRSGNTRTDVLLSSELSHVPTNASGRSIGAYEMDGSCLIP